MKYKTCEKCQLQEKWKDKVYRWMEKKFRVTTRKKKYWESSPDDVRAYRSYYKEFYVLIQWTFIGASFSQVLL